MDTQRIGANIANVRRRVSAAAEKYRRDPGDITLMAVSKTRPAEAVRAAAASGISEFGENYLQEALEKISATRDLPLHWHFIGPIQSNKTRAIAEHFDWVHSVDRLKIARRLDEQRPAGLPPLNICIQVNISGENSKSGVTPEQLAPMLGELQQCQRLVLRGLMAIPAPAEDFAEQRAAFRSVRELFEAVRGDIPTLDTLSMGMSGDLEAAIAEGATCVRIGTDIFGPRG
jgi:pyridoxal phosphate enzyme (YggS family)